MLHSELIELFANRRGTTFAGLDVVTSPKLTKKHRETGVPCPFSDVKKHARLRVMLGADYERRVQKVTEDPDFIVGPHQWSDEHAGYMQRKGESYYLQCMIQESTSVYTGLDTLHNTTRFIEPDELAGYLPAKRDNPTGIVTYSLDSIRTIRIDGQSYDVIKDVVSEESPIVTMLRYAITQEHS